MRAQDLSSLWNEVRRAALPELNLPTLLTVDKTKSLNPVQVRTSWKNSQHQKELP